MVSTAGRLRHLSTGPDVVRREAEGRHGVMGAMFAVAMNDTANSALAADAPVPLTAMSA